jgi:hypothetical protein
MVQLERESDGHADEPTAQGGVGRRPPAKRLALEIVVLLALAAAVIVAHLHRRADSPPIPTRQRTFALDEDEALPVYVRDWGSNDESAWQRLPIVGTGTSLAFDIPPGQEVKTVVQYGNLTPSRYPWYQKLLAKIGIKVQPKKTEPSSILGRFGPGEIHEVQMWADYEDREVTHRALVRLGSKTGLRQIRFVGFDINLPSDFAHLGPLKNLKALRFEDCRLHDSIFPEIGRLRWLRQLSLSNTATTNPLRLPDRKAYPPWRPALPIADANLAHLKPLDALEELDVSATSAGNEGLAWISRLPQLRYLELAGCNVGEEGLALIGQMRSLEFLSLSSNQDSLGFREGLAHLAKLPVLRILHLSAWPADQKILEQVARISSLWVLDLNGSRLDAESLAALRNLPQLRGLVLGQGIGDQGLLRVSNLSTLTALSLFGTRVSDAGLAYLTKLPALERLVLQGVGEAVTDAGLEHLAAVVTLREIRLKKTGATQAGVARLRQALPDCSITFVP